MDPATTAREHEALVYYLCRRYRAHPDYDDLLQEGRIALVEAAQRFDESHGLQFTTYATPRIRGAIAHYLRDRVNTIRLPRLQLHNPAAARVTTSLDAPDCDYLQPDTTPPDIPRILDIRRAVSRLSAKVRPVALLAADGYTNPEIAAILGVPRSTVEGRRAQARETLAAALTSE